MIYTVEELVKLLARCVNEDGWTKNELEVEKRPYSLVEDDWAIDVDMLFYHIEKETGVSREQIAKWIYEANS